jgi:Protein of unknown function (DUF4232)
VKAALIVGLLLLLPGTHSCEKTRAVASCEASQLRASQGRAAVGLGNRLQEVVFTNVSSRACLLRGHPTITAGGRPVQVLQGSNGGTYFGRLVPAMLKPGERGFLDFATANGTDCGGRLRRIARYRDLVFTLPQGGRVRARQVSITEHCSLTISALGRPERPG